MKRKGTVSRFAIPSILTVCLSIVSAGCTVNINSSESSASKIDARFLAERELEGDNILNFTDKDWETKGAQVCLRISDVLEKISTDPDNLELQVSEWAYGGVAFPEKSKWKPAWQLMEQKQYQAMLELDPSLSYASGMNITEDEFRELRSGLVAKLETESAESCATVGVELKFG